MTARHLIIGLDGADLGLIREFGPASLPNLHRAMETGAYAALESVQPPATLPNWLTFLTGVDPAVHGVFDFASRIGYQVRFTGGTIREAPTFAERLDALGKRCAVVLFPGTYPPPRLVHGVFISGWDSPIAYEADRSFVSPPELYSELVARFGTPRFDVGDELAATTAGWHERLPECLCHNIEKKTALAEWLLDSRSWDLFALYFGESDTASHYLYGLHDERSPRHPRGTTRGGRSGLRRVYEALDEAIGRIGDCAGTNVEITILSDHGSGGSSDKVLYLNRALAAGGFLTFRKPMFDITRVAKEFGLTKLSPRLRERLFRFANLPGRLESRVRFGPIDMTRTVAFSDELNYFPGIHWNLRGREPNGILDTADLPRLRLELEAFLLGLRDPFSGSAVVKRVLPREEIFDGPLLERAPDLLLDLHLDAGYSFNLAPSVNAPPGISPWRRLAPEEYLGRKARSLPGSHRSHGFLAMTGPQIRSLGQIDAHIADVSATVLARMGVAPGSDFQGRVLFEALAQGDISRTTLGTSRAVAHARSGSESRVEARLRALGYVE